MSRKYIRMAALLFIGLSSWVVNADMFIEEFPLKMTELCDENWNCEDVPSRELGGGQEVLAVNHADNMLKFIWKGEERWVHTTEVKMRKTAVASGQCDVSKRSDSVDISNPKDKEFAMIGISKEC